MVGGNGFIGSHLVDRLVQDGAQVIVLDLHERRYDPLPEAVSFVQGDLDQGYLLREAVLGVDTVFHLAWTTIHESSNQDPTADVLTNLIPSIRLLETCKWAGVRKIVFVSSGGTVYGLVQDLPIAESHPQNPISAYGITKLAVERYLQMFHHLYGLEYGQIPIQIAQAVPTFPQYSKHVSPLITHFSCPQATVLSSCWIECDGHDIAHFLHTLQNSSTPMSIGLSGIRGMSVVTAKILNRAPNLSLIRYPNRPIWPKPASIARGTMSRS